MKKRILGILLMLCMLLCFVPTAALAADDGFTDVATAEELFTATYGGGYVRLTDNITVESGSMYIDLPTELDLNGHTLTFQAPGTVEVTRYNKNDQATSSFTVGIAVNASFTLSDSDESKKGKLDVWGDDSTGIYVGPLGNLNMWGGTLTNSSVIPTGSEETPRDASSIGIYILRGKVSMTSGSRIENETQKGVFVLGGDFVMAGGTTVISGCGTQRTDRDHFGGGVYVASEYDENGDTVLGSFTMSMGARIENCSARFGGGVYLSGESVFNINVGYITGCKANQGGGVYVASVGKVAVEDGQIRRISPAFTMKGGSIEGCTANNGGGVFLSHGNVGSSLIEFEMSGGSIQSCSAINGGGVSLEKDTTFTMSGSAAVTGCTATGISAEDTEGYGGGVYMFAGGEIDLNGGSITGCKANAGDSIYSDATPNYISKYTVNGGTAEPTVSLAYVSGAKVIRMEGLGTEAYPYQIGTKEQLLLFRDLVNGINGQTQNLGACAVLTDDIVLNDGTFDDDGNDTSGRIGAAPEEWTPIGNYLYAYSGTFDGAGHTIKGLYYTGSNIADDSIDTDYEHIAGLFARLDGATVMNVTVTGYIQRNTNVFYGYIGVAGGIAGEVSNSTIRNCRSTCRITTDPDYGLVGGIAGIIDSTATIENCRNDGHITQHFGENCAAGGIAGSMSGGTVKGCVNTGKVDCLKSADMYNQVGCGGIVGRAYAGTISDCINIGEVNIIGNGGNAGGIVGYTDGDDITIRSCYSIGNVTAENDLTAGGICGTVRSGSPTFKSCYYLDTSAFYAIGSRADESDHVEKKTARDFADGTVLTALIAGRADDEHPWDTAGCKPLSDEASDTAELPVLVWMKLTERHHGGTAYCNAAKLCDGCGKAYGDPDPANHAPDGKQEWTKTAAAHEKQWSCCCAVTVASEPHEWLDGVCSECEYVCLHDDTDQNHICDICGKTVSDHTGGKATCRDKAICEICGEAYGSLASNNHTALRHIAAKAATGDAEGNREYWYCDGCGKYYSDAGAAKEITAADTVTAKLTNALESPQTGDNSSLMLWSVLLLISGGAAIGTMVASAKKRHNG